MTNEFMVLEFDYTGTYQDGGFGGTPCTSETQPCPVDGTKIVQLVFYADPGAGGFTGSIVIDYISFGEEPAGIIMSDVFQDHMDMTDSTIASFGDIPPGHSIIQSGSEVTISGDGTSTNQYAAIGIDIRNQTTWESIDIDATGNNKMYVKMKCTTPNTAIRFDLQDIDGFITTRGSVTKIVGTDYAVYEYDYSGTFEDLGFGGTPCTPETQPCPVNGERIANLVFYIEPGVGAFNGDLTIDYISFGTSLEPPGDEPDKVYADHFSNETIEFTTPVPGFTVTETGTDLVITGDGSAAPYGSISYLLHDKETGEQIVVDMGPAKNKLFVAARNSEGTVPLRIDIIDTTGYVSSQGALSKVVGEELTIYEYDFTGAQDGGFGGDDAPCNDLNKPCALDLSAITQVLLYPNPDEGGFDKVLTLDFLSIGQPLDDEDEDAGPIGVSNYSDQINENTGLYITDMNGLTSTTTGEKAPEVPSPVMVHLSASV
ncbi:MAG: hypothetical protein AAFO94_17010, partial [Bacteroidota bacterium]